MELTVGLLEAKLRKFPKGTAIQVNCGCCNHGALGDERILGIEDRTAQTYGYIELNLNNSSKAEVKLSTDKEYLEKRLSNVKIKVNSDIELSITGEAYVDINNFEIINNGDESINMVIKNIENYVER